MLLRRVTPRAKGILASITLVLAVGCSTPTSTTQIWQAQGVVRAPLTRVVVFGGGATETGRRTLEDGWVASLAERGVTAKPSYEIFPMMPDKERARGTLQSMGFDGALISAVRAVHERPEYMPGTPYTGTGFWDGPGWAYSPGYVVTDQIVNIETKLWDLRANGVLVWSATTQTTNPSSTGDAVRSVTKELIPKLVEGGIIPGKR